MTRDDILVLLNGIIHNMEDHWVFADLDDDEIAQSYRDLDRFDSDVEVGYGLVEFLEDWKDAFEEIAWSIDLVCSYIRTCFTPQQFRAFLDGEVRENV